MKLYIPKHLREIELIDQLYRMIEEYGKSYSQTSQESFNNYYISQSNDPVKIFLELCISRDSIGSDQDYDEVINYLSKLFYSAKGTVKIFDYMVQFLGLDFDGEIIYDSKEITINLNSLNISNETLFYNSLKDFLDSLVYYEKLNTNIGSVDLIIESNFINYVSGNLRSYSKITVEPYEIDY